MMGDEHCVSYGFFLGMTEELELTGELVERLRILTSEIEKQMIQTTTDLEIAHIELHDFLSWKNVGVNAVDAKIEITGELRTKMHKAHIHRNTGS